MKKQWDAYVKYVLSPEVKKSQLRDLKLAFFAGALAFQTEAIVSMEEATEDDNFRNVVKKLHAELGEFLNDLKLVKA